MERGRGQKCIVTRGCEQGVCGHGAWTGFVDSVDGAFVDGSVAGYVDTDAGQGLWTGGGVDSGMYNLLEMATVVVGTLPTAMHSWFIYILTFKNKRGIRFA